MGEEDRDRRKEEKLQSQLQSQRQVQEGVRGREGRRVSSTHNSKREKGDFSSQGRQFQNKEKRERVRELVRYRERERGDREGQR